MENNPYNLDNLPSIMREIRKRYGFNQFQLGRLLGGKGQQYISDVENGLITLTPQLCIKWFEACEAYEHIDLVHYLFRLHPTAAAPIDPALNESASTAVINMIHQLKEALQATENLGKWLARERPGRAAELPINEIKQIFDLIPANKTLIYSLARNHGLKIQEVADRWTRKALVDHVAMARKEERQAV
ncbi:MULTISPECIES: helix-turn-helix domain-containing protein [Bacillus]|uniref:Helix-turn-helix domain-containing protein n=1 Tax=Bacillus glycinifermentans TaxID=1664069 RepID=A0A0T6BTF2_9BACI|nr:MULTISPECIES: helix-turn-helix transcriptional regulator [Bacillus]KKB72456.1 transcriptional regulator [Bacillus sp. TH008]KRT94814.1 transcriptional regulator [Bacillus glycinifermentans]MBU8787099.1 helix-turn-helix transcriptional regulator [Bacillus glycinifermentans]MDU0070076.1 helix-turn-helix transcriptional regulator [Bacillus sp. IG6]MEC0487800.1 helix-turn-helix transcriptional regulator [Bacillus glycinifermentans]